MSINSLIRKARRLKVLARPDGTARKKYFYSFKDLEEDKEINVVVGTENEMTKLIGCTCKFHSVKDPRCTALCSYFLAVLFKMEGNIK